MLLATDEMKRAAEIELEQRNLTEIFRKECESLAELYHQYLEKSESLEKEWHELMCKIRQEPELLRLYYDMTLEIKNETGFIF